MKKKIKTSDKAPKYINMNDVSKSVIKIVEWNKRMIGLSANLQKSLKRVKDDTTEISITNFLREFEESSILQELYGWYSKSIENRTDKTGEGEIVQIVEAFFDRLHDYYNVKIIEKPGKIIPTPKSSSKLYIFNEKYDRKLNKCRVLKCGFKMGNKVISPCLLEQVMV